MSEQKKVTDESVINPDLWYSFAILKDGKNIFHCNEEQNALFHLKDLAENKYLPMYKKEYKKEHGGREVYIDLGDLKTKYRIVRKTEGKFRWESIVECCTLEMIRVPCIRRIKPSPVDKND